MIRVLLCSLFLGLSSLALGADARSVAIAQSFVKAWAADGVVVKTGFEADGTQNLAVFAKGGYFPLKMTAQAGVKSVLRVYTNRTNDCSRSFFLPDLKMQAILPPKGVKEFVIPAMKKGATLFGTCGMGMYTFEISFTE